ncbi:MAG: hypothetical protein ACYS15_18445 [Planctomycetota bacterium]
MTATSLLESGEEVCSVADLGGGNIADGSVGVSDLLILRADEDPSGP